MPAIRGSCREGGGRGMDRETPGGAFLGLGYEMEGRLSTARGLDDGCHVFGKTRVLTRLVGGYSTGLSFACGPCVWWEGEGGEV